MEGRGTSTAVYQATSGGDTPLYAVKSPPHAYLNRLFAAVYASAVLTLLFRHAKTLLYHSTTTTSAAVTLLLLLSDLVLAFMWCTAQALRARPIRREEFPENLERVLERGDFPGLDVFVCTADPEKEPPMSTVNTVLSVMAYDYPAEKVSVYVSDDGGSQVTLFALMEAAKFAKYWLPFCRENDVVKRCPKAYFESNDYASSSEQDKIKTMYERMKGRVESAVERGKVSEEYIIASGDEEVNAFNKWTHDFTRHSHPTVIQVLLENDRDKDIAGNFMPNLIYVSREKSKTSHHHFKAGALNVLIRVSGIMTNASILLTLDCDMYSNDPKTPIRVLCYYSDPKIRSEYSYVQFPQHFHGINKNDIYASEFKRLFQIQPMGFDGLGGTNNVGTNCFFSRQAFFGRPSSLVSPQLPELNPNHVVNQPIRSEQILKLAHEVTSCNFEAQTSWGSKLGYRYGSLVEDMFTGYQLRCEGWKSIFCNPDRSAFLGDSPLSLVDSLNQQKRCAVGALEVGFSKYSPITYGIKNKIGPLMSLAYLQYALWPIWGIPITVYAFLPQLALLNHISIFPKVSEPYWFLLYVFLYLGAYGQDLLDFAMAGGTFQSWWNDQRIWALRGFTCLLFGSAEFFLKTCGIHTQGFNVTSKVVDDEQSKRYVHGVFDFGVHSPMFVTLVMAAAINMASLVFGVAQFLRSDDNIVEGLLLQFLISGYGVVNCLPVYEAMVLRSDNGKIPTKTTLIAVFLAWVLYVASSLVLG